MTLRNYSSTAAETTLSGGVDASTTTLTVSATTGFPATPFVLAIDAGAAAQELVLVTNVAGTTLTVTRAFDSTVASAHSTGAVVAHSHAAIDFREANTHVNAESGVHGVTGDVVGTSDTQTLTDKTVALGSNTVSGTKEQFDAALTDGDFATLAGVETLTNKDLSSGTNVFPEIAASVPKGVLGYVTGTSNTGGISTLTDITGMSVTVTAGTSRRLRITGIVNTTHFTAGAINTLMVREGSSVHAQSMHVVGASTVFETQTVVANVVAPSAGSHTYKLSLVTNTGASAAYDGSVTPMQLLVEDLGSSA